MTDLYVKTLEYPDRLIDGKTFNAGYDNMKMKDIAAAVKKVVVRDTGKTDLAVEFTPTDDNRSYHVSSQKIKKELGFEAKRSVEDAVKDLVAAFKAGRVPDPMTDIRYYNIKTMQAIKLK